MINRTASKVLAPTLKDLGVGGTITSERGTVFALVGIVDDLRFGSYTRDIRPEIFALDRGGTILTIKTLGEGSSLVAASQILESVFPGYQLAFESLDTRLSRLFRQNQLTIEALGLFAFAVLILALMGLAVTIDSALKSGEKEIVVRRIHGAKRGRIFALFGERFARPVLVGNLAVLPFVWWSSSRWLEGYAIRIDLHPAILSVAVLVTLLLAQILVFIAVVRATRMRPAKILR